MLLRKWVLFPLSSANPMVMHVRRISPSSSTIFLQNSTSIRPKLNFHIETYGCQMNINDSEVIRSILLKEGHSSVTTPEDADLILTNTCAIRYGTGVPVPVP